MSSAAAAHNQAQINQSLADYGQLQGDKAVKIAAHAHIIEFGLLAMLLAFFQPYVQLSEIWKADGQESCSAAHCCCLSACYWK